MKKINMISAVAIDGAIGKDNKLLWNLPEDLKRYKELTTGNVLIVGSTTFLGLPKVALQNRVHIVIDGGQNPSLESQSDPEVYVVRSIEDSIILARKIASEDQEIYVIGGGSIYDMMIDKVDKVLITWINKTYPDADRMFPTEKLDSLFKEIDKLNWSKSLDGNLEYKYSYYIKK
jgi:dihydrofolate reductase